MNLCIWVPHFLLSNVQYTLWEVEKGNRTERDIGDILINFMMIEEVRPFCAEKSVYGRSVINT